MKMMAKLLIGFFGVALICVFVGTTGLSVIASTQDNLLVLANETLPKLDYVSTIDRQFRNIMSAMHALANPYGISERTFYADQLAIIEAARAKYKDARAAYELLPMTDAEKKQYDVVLKKLDVAAIADNSVLTAVQDSLAMAGDDREEIQKRIFDMVTNDASKKLTELVAEFEVLFNYVQNYYGVEMPKETLANVARGRALLLAMIATALAIAIALGISMGLMISGRLKKCVAILEKISRGDLTDRIEIKTADEFKQVSDSLNRVSQNVLEMANDTNSLVKSALAGQLSTRAEASKHEGSYRKIVEGINAMLDAVTAPIEISTGYIDRISRGDLPESITEEFKGDFNVIKEKLNLAITSIHALVSDANMLAEAAVAGALQTRADASRHQGDYRKIVEGVDRTLDLVTEPLGQAIDILKLMADGDLTGRMEGDYRGDFDILKTAMNETLESVSGTMSQINVAVEQVAEGSVQVSQASQALSQGATEQAASLEEITSSTTQISGQTRQNTENAVKMNALAKEAQGNAIKGNEQMKDLVGAMNDINTSAEEIRKIVKAIDDISFQINLLALNANVEAARAGKYGKGFAVVAEEVRNLAVRSANSVKETTRMVDEAIGNIQRGNALVGGTAKQLDQIVTGAEEVSIIAEEVSVAGREQTQGLEQISQGLNQIDQVTQNNTASAEESASASEELSSQAQQVKSMLARFRLDSAAAARAQAARPDADARPVRKPAPMAAIQRAQPAAARKKMPVRPSDVISLDDDNFGKF
jgi:methyl-accepting chemotaxis protein